VVNGSRAILAYGKVVGLPPFSSRRTSGYLERLSLAPIFARVGAQNVGLSNEDRDSILASAGGPVEDGTIPDMVASNVLVRNRSALNRSFVVFRPAMVYAGWFAVRACGAPYNDGWSVERLRGRYSTISNLAHLQTYGCGTPVNGPWERLASKDFCD